MINFFVKFFNDKMFTHIQIPSFNYLLKYKGLEGFNRELNQTSDL